jgi:hypothetical protein
MVYNTQNYWDFALYPSAGILKPTEHNISETGFVSAPQTKERHLLSWVPYKKLTSITALSYGRNRVGVSQASAEDGIRSSFRNVVFSSF